MANATEARRAQEFQRSDQPEAREGSRPRAATPLEQVGTKTAEQTSAAGAQASAAAADIIREMTRRVADQSQHVLRIGLSAVTEAQAPLAEAGFDHSRRFVETATRVTDICFDAAQRTADDAHALAGSFSNLGRGMQAYQRACYDMMSQSYKDASQKRQALFQVNSPVKLAEMQRDIYLGMVNDMFAGSTKLLEIMGQVAQTTMQPLQERAQAHAQN